MISGENDQLRLQIAQLEQQLMASNAPDNPNAPLNSPRPEMSQRRMSAAREEAEARVAAQADEAYYADSVEAPHLPPLPRPESTGFELGDDEAGDEEAVERAAEVVTDALSLGHVIFPGTTGGEWLYLDPQQELQGPWAAEVLANWYASGFLMDELPVRPADALSDTDFIALAAVVAAGHAEA